MKPARARPFFFILPTKTTFLASIPVGKFIGTPIAATNGLTLIRNANLGSKLSYTTDGDLP